MAGDGDEQWEVVVMWEVVEVGVEMVVEEKVEEKMEEERKGCCGLGNAGGAKLLWGLREGSSGRSPLLPPPRDRARKPKLRLLLLYVRGLLPGQALRSPLPSSRFPQPDRPPRFPRS